MIVPLYCVLVQPSLEYSVQFSGPQHKVIKVLYSIQMMVKGLEEKPYKKQLRLLHLFSLEKIERRIHHSLHLSHRGRRGSDTDLFSVVTELEKMA